MVSYPYYATPQNVGQFYTQQQPRQVYEQPQPQIGIKGRPVTSIDEVRATTIDFDGSIFYFPDLANKRIYTKQINYDGTSTLNIYELKPMVNNSNNPYVTRDEFAAFVSQLQQRLAGAEAQSAPQIAQQSVESKPVEVAASTVEAQTQAQAPAAPASPHFNF